jgi:hypothetical protein
MRGPLLTLATLSATSEAARAADTGGAGSRGFSSSSTPTFVHDFDSGLDCR